MAFYEKNWREKQRKHAEVRMNIVLPDEKTPKEVYEDAKGKLATFTKGRRLPHYFFSRGYWDYSYPQAIVATELGRGTIKDHKTIQPSYFDDIKDDLAGYVNMDPILIMPFSTAGVAFHISYGLTNGDEDYIHEWMNNQIHLDSEYKLLMWDTDKVIKTLGKKISWEIDYSKFLALRPNPEPEIFEFMQDFYTRGRVGMMFYELRMLSQDPDKFDTLVQKRYKRFSNCAFATNLILNTPKEHTETISTFEVTNEFKRTMVR